ncbi:MAG: ABC transporter substrate-binding protein, partial [Acidimicrobiales bacterium]|nr:ABC transporter substrate-binding protein [Acidimicrobiales bacterium]
MMHRRKARWSAPVLAVVLGMSACTSGGDTPPDTTIAQTTSTTVVVEGSTLTVATRAPESLEAHHAISTRAVDIASLLHTGLSRIDSEGRAVPGLAESWTSDDLVTWTFVLRPGSTFSDGTPITAQTFVDSWFALASQRTRGRTAYLGVEAGIANWRDVLAGVEGRQLGLRVVDERTLEVQLEQNNPWLPEYLAHSAFAPVAPSTLAALNPDGTSTTPLLGSGPFVIESGSLDDATMTLARRAPTGQAGEVGRITLQFVDSDQAAADAVGVGTADVGLADGALDVDGLQMAEHPSNQVWYMGFPTPRGPASSPEPRRALSLSIDRSRFGTDLAT